MAEKYPKAYRAVLNKYYVDEFYKWAVVNNLLRITRASAWFDNNIVDGAVNGAGWVTLIAVRISGWIDNTFVDGAVNLVADVVKDFGEELRVIQTGHTR